MSYSAHDSFVEPARARPQVWRLILGLVLAMAVYVVIFLVIALVAVSLSPSFQAAALEARGDPDLTVLAFERRFLALAEGRGPADLLILLGTFAGMAAGAIVAALALHNRGLRSLLGPWPQVWRHFAVAAGITLGILGVSAMLPPWIDTAPNIDVSLWLILLPLSLLLILLQTGAEELLFRGYLQQQLAARFRSPWVWMVIPSVLFGLGHINPGVMGGATGAVVGIVIITTCVGLLTADLTARTGSLGAAWGFHFANNVLAILTVSLDGMLGGLALRIVIEDALTETVFAFALLRYIIALVIVWLVIRTVLTRREKLA